MREAGSANAIGCEINAKGKQQCIEYPWNQLAISETDIITRVNSAIDEIPS